MSFPRAAGILLHPTSLPSRGGVGDFGPAAYQFVDFLASARQGVWQVLPLGPLGYGNSPYSSTSAFAGNPLLISLERLAEHGWIDPAKLDSPKWIPQFRPRAQFGCGGIRPASLREKMPLLFEAARNFLRHGCRRCSCAALKHSAATMPGGWMISSSSTLCAPGRNLKAGIDWPRDLAHREPAALEKAREELADDIQIRSALQFAFYEQWRALRRYCARARDSHRGRCRDLRESRQRRRVDPSRTVSPERESGAGSRGGSASGFFQQDRAALGKSAVPLGCDEGARL